MDIGSKLRQYGFVIPIAGSSVYFGSVVSSVLLGLPLPDGAPDPSLARLDTLLSAQLAGTLVGLTLAASAFVYAAARPLREEYDQAHKKAEKALEDYKNAFGKATEGSSPPAVKDAPAVKEAAARLRSVSAPGSHLYKALLSFLATLILVLAADTVLAGQSVSLYLEETNVAVTLLPISTGLAELFMAAKLMGAIFKSPELFP